MDINFLCEFLAIAEKGSFTLAAEELCISQSSLSKHIKSLETELGIQLFDRSTRSVKLSEVGKLILPYVAQLNDINSEIINIIRQYKSKQKRIKIASIPVMAQYDITGLISRFQKDYPDIPLSVVELESHNIPHLLETGECELAFVRIYEETASGYDYITLYKDHMIAVLPHTHELAHEKEINLLKLRDEKFLLLDKKTMLFEQCYNLCVSAGFMPNISYTGHRPENIIDLVSNGMGVSLLMERHAKYFRNDKVVCVAITPTIESNICLVKNKNRSLSPNSKLFWNYIKEIYSSG
jgi:LysR family transcriptional activator of glutamate synthase operon